MKTLLELLEVGTPGQIILVVNILEVFMRQMPKHIVEVINHDNYILNLMY